MYAILFFIIVIRKSYIYMIIFEERQTIWVKKYIKTILMQNKK